MNDDSKAVLIFPQLRFCACGKLMHVRTVPLLEPLVSQVELHALTVRYGAGSSGIKEQLERFPAFEYYGLIYECPAGHQPSMGFDWHYTQEEAKIIEQWFADKKA